MALLIDLRAPNWMQDAALGDILAPLLPGIRIHCGPPSGPMPDVAMLATSRMVPGMTAHLPNLQLVQKMGAGVETMLSDPDLPPQIRVARLEPHEQADEMAEYALAYVLAYLRDIPHYIAAQATRQWQDRAPRRAAGTNVAVLGLGHIGRRCADAFLRSGFQVQGWSRTPRQIDAIACYAGPDGLADLLAVADFIVAALPSTPATRGLVGPAFLDACRPGAVLINMGRGDLVDDAALVAALDDGRLAGAVLDVFHAEPLDRAHPFWAHPKVLVTPHVAGWSISDAIADVAENYRRLIAGQPLLREVDRAVGY
ncbi:MAG: glyoxylate/hydroxypyruvate reductase A [Rhodobacteraceae bacterium]|nr:glyoxylate/hydroxypyruvate reductase A [Paracoccaceae bacterium]